MYTTMYNLRLFYVYSVLLCLVYITFILFLSERLRILPPPKNVCLRVLRYNFLMLSTVYVMSVGKRITYCDEYTLTFTIPDRLHG